MIGNRVKIGPFAHLRAGCAVGDERRGGQLRRAEEHALRRPHASSTTSATSATPRSARGSTSAPGTITANYDGERKHRTIIGDGAFIGSDTILRAPITVGEGAYTGAGSVVTKDVPPGKLAVGVPARIRERASSRPSRDGQVAERPMEILIIAILIFLNALFVAAEFSLVRVRRTRIEQLVEEGNRGARRVDRLLGSPGRFLATIQIGLTFVGFLAATFAGASIVGDLATILQPCAGQQRRACGPARGHSHRRAVHDPVRRAGAQGPRLRLCRAAGFPLRRARSTCSAGCWRPLVWLLTTLTQAITRLFGIADSQGSGSPPRS